MEYQALENSGILEIEYIGAPLDLYSFGILQINLQDIIDKVSFGILHREGLLEPSRKRSKYIPSRPPIEYRRFIKAEINSIRIGSLEQSIAFTIASVLADPNVISIMQNLAANVVWAIWASGVRAIKDKYLNPPKSHFIDQRDPFDVGPNIREIVLAVAENSNGRTAEIKIKHRSPDNEITQVIIKI